MSDETDDLVKRINDACIGHPHAKIPWPHRLLHDARDRIEAQAGVITNAAGIMVQAENRARAQAFRDAAAQFEQWASECSDQGEGMQKTAWEWGARDLRRMAEDAEGAKGNE